MNKGFSLVECVVYVLCLTIVFGLLGEMVFKFYLRINSDLKSIQQFTNSAVCLNNLICDLYQAMSSEAVKKEERNAIIIKLKDGEVVWALKEGKLYRYFKKFGLDGHRPNKTASLMMRNVLDFDIDKYINNVSLMNFLSGFKINLKLDSALNTFEHHVAIRGFD